MDFFHPKLTNLMPNEKKEKKIAISEEGIQILQIFILPWSYSFIDFWPSLGDKWIFCVGNT